MKVSTRDHKPNIIVITEKSSMADILRALVAKAEGKRVKVVTEDEKPQFSFDASWSS